MITHAPRFPLSLDPLIAEAKQRTRRRRLLLAAALALVLAGSAAGVIATRSPASANGKVTALGRPGEIRSCGMLGVGIGWRVLASSTLSCGSGMKLMRTYFRANTLADITVLGYACTGTGLGRITCTRGETRVTAVANH
jgi:hypothetical protein